MPFHVTVKDMTVEVLGTHFNIMAYDDEKNISTTLLEGAVKVSRGSNTGLLQPGQQALTAATGGGFRISATDAEGAVAWKNGMFQFNGDDLGKIMRQISRWYNVSISFEGQVPAGHYTGSISRNVPLAKALHLLELNGLRFKTEGGNVEVLAAH
jgi:ferric-dicitrate binding protein FerR (iron transport regulator)